MSDPACGLVFRDAPGVAEDTGELLSRRAQQLLWLLVVGLHVLLAVLWQQATRLRAAAVDTALEVVWISVPRSPEPVVPPMPQAPARTPPAQSPSGLRTPQDQSVEAAGASVPSPAAPAADLAVPLFTPDGRVRMAQPAFAVGEWGDRERISRDRMPRLPGATDAAAAEVVAIRLRRQFTPEDIVLAVVQFVMGRPRPDDCSKIEGRLHMSDEGVSREIDLNKFRRICTGMSLREAFND